jgi:hypothetical protein
MSLVDLPGAFDTSRIVKLRHQLASHPLMTTESLAALALRVDPRNVRLHDGERDLSGNMSELLISDPTRQSLRNALDNLDRSKAFIQVSNVRSDLLYAPLVEAFIDEVVRYLPGQQRELVHRDAAVYLASPESMTPFHVDQEETFLCHIRGPKTLWVWSHLDRSVLSERALETFFREGTLREIVYRPEVQPRAKELELQPGDAVFMPTGAPHAAMTGADVTVSFSVLFNTPGSMETVETFRANHLLRRLGLNPPPVGHSPMQDALKRHGMVALRRLVELATGRKLEAYSFL